jgi:tetratricopeptide (TPR) repeat protein
MSAGLEILSEAFWHHQSGRLLEAGELYQRVLELDPGNVDAWHLLGVLAFESHDDGRARECLERAVALKPDYAAAQYNLGNVLYRQGHVGEAISHYRAATRIHPTYVEALQNLASALYLAGESYEAENGYRRVLELKPEHANAHYNLGNLLYDRGALDDAEACYRRALELDENLREGWLKLGLLTHQRGRLAQALDYLRRAVAKLPTLPEAHYCLGLVHLDLGACNEAARCFQQAVCLNPRYSHGWNDLGNALKELGQLEDAIESFRKAVLESPSEPKFHNNLATALMDAGRLDAAQMTFETALQLEPSSAVVRWNRSLLTLLRGNYDQGWQEYEWRWRTGKFAVRSFTQPQWNGESLNGRTILLHCEQGYGDTIQFIRFGIVLKGLGARVVVLSPQQLMPLLASCSGVDELVGEGEPLPNFDFHLPLMSVARVLKTTVHSIPNEVPYLSPDPDLVRNWRTKLENIAGFRIGINWEGRGARGASRKRDIPLEHFSALAKLPGVRLISLQKGKATDALTNKDRPAVVDFSADLDQDRGAFMDTAAIMANLDLIVSSDTSVPHLAGALAVPVWLALPYVPDWRWLLERTDSPWYPTMRLFRQKQPGDWAGVFAEIQLALAELLGQST